MNQIGGGTIISAIKPHCQAGMIKLQAVLAFWKVMRGIGYIASYSDRGGGPAPDPFSEVCLPHILWAKSLNHLMDNHIDTRNVGPHVHNNVQAQTIRSCM